MASAVADSLDSFSTSMKPFKQFCHWCLHPHHLFLITLIVLLLPNVALCFTERMSILAALANVLLPGGAYWLLLTLSRKPGRMVWGLFFFIFLAAFQLVLLYLFGRSIIAVDMFLNLVTTNPGEAMELLDNMTPAIVGVVVVYVPVLTLGVMSILGKEEASSAFLVRQRKVGGIVLGAGVLALAGCYLSDKDYRAELQLYPANVVYNMVLAGERTYQTEHYAETSRGFSFKAHATHPRNWREVYVLVIGETARSCEMGLYGYGRTVLPQLQHEDGLVAFTNVLSQSNTTHKSVPMLLSAASATDYDRIYKEKGLIEAFREAGFHTTFLSNQLPNHSFIDFFGEEADEWLFVKETSAEGKNTPDGALLPLVDKVLERKRAKELIVLHTYGSHFNYRDRYPRAAARFRPDDASEAKASNRGQLVNAYDNSILYTENFLCGLIQRINQPGVASAMLYTSDHGENIFDDARGLFLHASPIPSYYELHVPFLVWLSDTYQAACPSVLPTLRANRKEPVASNASTFHTMLSLAGIATPYRADTLSVASDRLHSAPRSYLNDHNQAVSLERAGLGVEDFLLLRQHSVTY